MSRYKHKDEFVVRHFVPCPLCAAMLPEGEVKKRTRYVYPVGYAEQVSCQDCFNKAVSELSEQAKLANKPEGWDYV